MALLLVAVWSAGSGAVYAAEVAGERAIEPGASVATKISAKHLSGPERMAQSAQMAQSTPMPLSASTSVQALSAAAVKTSAGVVKPRRQVLLLLVNRLDLADLAQMPHLQQWEAAGAVGVMNVNTGGARTIGNAYATMALGTPARLSTADLQVVSHEESWQQVLSAGAAPVFGQRFAGTMREGVVVVSGPRLERSLSQNGFAAKLGAAGDVLRAAGLQAGVFGSSDALEERLRPAALFTSDSQGVTSAGDVGARMLASAPDRPFGVRTDYQALWTSYLKQQDRLALAVFDLADLYRLSVYRGQLSQSRAAMLHQQTLAEVDRFVGMVLQQRKPNQLLLLAVPQVSDAAAARQEWLTPVLAVGGDIPAHSVLRSATTRRDGIVTNLDVMPTVLRYLGCAVPKEMIGYPLAGSAGVAQERLGGILQGIVWRHAERGVVFGLVGLLAGGGFLAALLRLGFGWGLSFRLVRELLLAMLAMPLCLYVLPLFSVRSLAEAIGGLVALYLLFVAIPFRILPLGQSLRGRFLWLGAWTVGVVLVDTWQGGRLAQNSLLSYDVVDGARYYGIGNEYMGIVVGAAVLFYGALLQGERVAERALGVWGVLGGVFLTTFFASPLLGTNTGGALTMAATTGFCLAQQKRWRWWKALLMLAGSLLMAASLLYVQNLDSAPPSHIGAAANQVLAGGVQELLSIWHRKSNLFWHFFTVSIWPTVVVMLLVWAGYWMRGQSELDRKRMGPYAAMRAPLGGLLLGAWVGLFTNDSGVVVAAMMVLFAVWPTLLMELEAEQELVQELQRAEVA